MPPVRGIVFDMDGTLVDSKLDYDAIRKDLGLPPESPILEFVLEIKDSVAQQQMLDTMHRHELQGAECAILYEGVREFLDHLDKRGIFKAVLTRSSRACAIRTLDRFDLQFSQVVTRDDAAPKPDPSGVKLIAERWGIETHEIVVVGDYLFDLQAGRNAGARSILFAPGEIPHFAEEADELFRHYHEAIELLERLHEGH